MSAPLRFLAAALSAFVLSCADAQAERVIATVAPSAISISASYSGGSIVVFGAIAEADPSSSYDVVVTVTGPRQNLLVRRKERVLGVWINRQSRNFEDVPSYLAVFANRPFDAIASADTLREHRVGLKHSLFVDKTVDVDDPFQTNLIRTRLDEDLYIERPRGVSFVSPAVFRAEIPLPKSALTGTYDVEMKIFAKGAAVARTSSTFTVEKVGVAQFVVKSSIDYSLIYGLATMGLALLTGWIASVAFRRG